MAQAAIARLGLQPMSTFVQPVTGAPWRTIPSTYVLCTGDEAIHPDRQAAMAERCTNTVTLDTDHSPFASMPAETADIIESVSRG